MATQTVLTATEFLVDLFLDGDVEEPDFVGEGCVEVGEAHDGIPTTDFNAADQVFLRQKCGQTMREIGEEINKKYEKVKKKSLADGVIHLFDDPTVSAQGNPEEFWQKFRDLQDAAIRDTGLDDAMKIMAAVLFSVKGLGYLGGCIREFTLRYIREKKLDDALKPLARTDKKKASRDEDCLL